jgi:hypothetical protein
MTGRFLEVWIFDLNSEIGVSPVVARSFRKRCGRNAPESPHPKQIAADEAA